MKAFNLASHYNQQTFSTSLKWIVALMALWSLVWSVQLFIAGNAYYSVKNNIDMWQQRPERATTEKIERALNKIETALSYFPKNALYYQVQGQLYEWKAYSVGEAGVSSDTQTAAIDSVRNLYHIWTLSDCKTPC